MMTKQWGAEAYSEAQATNRKASRLTMHPRDYDPALLPHPSRTAIEIKMDGIGLTWGLLPGRCITNEGVDMGCADHLVPGLMELERRMGGRMFFHGEYFASTFSETLSSFRTGRHTGAVWVHDAVPRNVWDGSAPSSPLHVRRALLAEAIKGMEKQGIYLMRQVAGHIGEDAIEDMAGVVWEDGGEGVVIKDMDSPYIRADTPYWMRLKRGATIDLPILHANINEDGTVRSFAVQVPDGKRCNVPVQAPEMKARPTEFRTGRMVEINHLGRTDAGSLRSPSFGRFRDDKA